MTSVKARDVVQREGSGVAAKPVHHGVRTVSGGNTANAPVGTSKGPRPPPPKRISSLMPVSPTVPTTAKPPTEPTLTEAGATANDKPPTRQASLKQPPPKRPPPPRPGSMISNQPTVADKKSEKPSRPPSASTKSSGAEGSGIHPRGSSLMGSLKKLVKRDSKKKADKPMEVDDSEKSAPKPQRLPERPSHPPKRTTVKKDTAVADATPEDNSPVPKPRKKKSVSSPTVVPSEVAPSISPSPQTNPPPSNPPPRPAHAPVSSVPAPLTQSTPARPSQQPVAAASRQQEQAQASSKPEKLLQEKPPSPSPAVSDSKPKEATSSQSDRRKSTNIPSKPKPPLAPKPSISSLATKPEGGADSKSTPAPTTTSSKTEASKQTSPEPTNFYRATKTYTGKTGEELSFSPGDMLMFIEKKEGGFYYGMLDNGTTGLFPVNCTEPFFK